MYSRRFSAGGGDQHLYYPACGRITSSQHACETQEDGIRTMGGGGGVAIASLRVVFRKAGSFERNSGVSKGGFLVRGGKSQ